MSRKLQNQILNTMIASALHFIHVSGVKLSADKLFQMVWGIVFNQLYLNGIRDGSVDIEGELFGAYQLNVREFLLYKIVSIFRHHKIDYAPFVYTDDLALLKKIKASKKSVVLVSIHNGFSHNLKLFEDQKRAINTIGLRPYVDEALERSGIKGNVNIITKDKYSLAYLKKVIADGGLISCTVDFSVNKGPFQFIKANLFKFAAQGKLQVYFTKSEVQDNGQVKIMLGAAPSIDDGDANAQAYIEFYNSTGYTRRNLTVGE